MNQNDRDEFNELIENAPPMIKGALEVLFGSVDPDKCGWETPGHCVVDLIEPLHDLTIGSITMQEATTHVVDRICTNAARTHTAAKFYAGGLVGQLSDLAGTPDGHHVVFDAVVVDNDGNEVSDPIASSVAAAAKAASHGHFDSITDTLNTLNRYDQIAVVTGLFTMDYELGRQRMEQDGVRFDADGRRLHTEPIDWPDEVDVPAPNDPFWTGGE